MARGAFETIQPLLAMAGARSIVCMPELLAARGARHLAGQGLLQSPGALVVTWAGLLARWRVFVSA